MQKDKILSRILDVYNESIRSADTINETIGSISSNAEEHSKLVVMQENSSRSYSQAEIDGNYLLFFNDIYNSFFRKLTKKIAKKIGWPFLKRQVFFNMHVRQILNELIRENYQLIKKNKEDTERYYSIEQKIDLINSELESKLLQQRREDAERYYSIEQKIDLINSDLESKLLQQSREDTERYYSIEQKIDTIDSDLGTKIKQIDSKLDIDRSLKSQSVSIQKSKIASNLWFNDAINIGYLDNEAYWAGTNERIIEKNFVLISLARLYESEQIQILDVGAAESSLAYELASLNYAVTAIDIRPIALSHPNLKFVKSDICQPVLPTASFDCVIALSTLEHIGLGWYGDEVGKNLDRQAVSQIYSLLRPDGILILTVPYGKEALTPVHRIYDRKSLQNLIENFSVVRAMYGIRLDDFTYTVTENEAEASEREHHPHSYLPGAVAMLVCRKK